MPQKFIQAQKFKLSGSGVTSTATTIGLQSFKTPDETNITTSDLGTTAFGSLEPGTEREEIISFTGVTQNANGTATLTGVTRGLKFVSPYTTDAALKQQHAGGTIFVLTNNPQLYEDLISFNNDESITGLFTFDNAKPPRLDAFATPTADEEFATKKYVDDTAGSGPISINRVIPVATAGETVAAGDFIYFDLTDNEWKKTDASAPATSEDVLLGIAQGAGTDGNPITGGVLLFGLDSNQSGLTQGDTEFLSDTAGAIANSAGTQEVEVGIAISATEMYFSPRFASVPTGATKDLIEAITASAAELNTLDGYTGNTADLNEMETFFGSTDITGAEVETLTDGSVIGEGGLHEHSTVSRHNYSTAFEGSARFNTTLSGGSATFAVGLLQATSAAAGSFVKTRFSSALISHRAFADGDPEILIHTETQVAPTTGESFFGMAQSALAVAGTGITYNTVHQFGFKIIYAASTATHSATNANGVTETATSFAAATSGNYYAIQNVGTNIRFYFNGALVATHTTNLPSSTSNVDYGIFAVSNKSTATNFGLTFFQYNATERVK